MRSVGAWPILGCLKVLKGAYGAYRAYGAYGAWGAWGALQETNDSPVQTREGDDQRGRLDDEAAVGLGVPAPVSDGEK